MLPKTKAISIGIIHKDPNQIKFLEQVITKFEEIVLKTEYYVIRDFIINLLFKGTDTLDKLNEIKKFYRNSINNFFQILGNMLNFVLSVALNR